MTEYDVRALLSELFTSNEKLNNFTVREVGQFITEALKIAEEKNLLKKDN